MVSYSDNGKYAYFDGLRFCRDNKTGYYLNTTIHKRLHRYVYEKLNGPIPKGYQIHHIDHDKGNNEPGNLELLTASQHSARHMDEMTDDMRARLRRNMLDNAIPAAAHWHSSPEGSTWHRTHYEAMKDKLHARQARTCKYCGKTFAGTMNPNNVFCSNTCKSAWRRRNGIDDEQRTCIICGHEFTTSRYSAAKCCSASCANRYRRQNSRHKEAAAAARV